jgi:3'(2'), 5'-bisphosphate nucleotidase
MALEHHDNIWDHAAGSIIVEETGGCVNDMRGTPLDFTKGAKLHANRGVV